MPHNPPTPGRDRPSVPSMLDLVRLSPRRLFPPGGEALYRQLALLTGMGPGQEVLDAGCGRGVSLEYFAREFEVQGSGVDFDSHMVGLAEARIREEELGNRIQVQQAPLDQLPYRDEIFDVAVGELGLTAHADPRDAVRELVRVTKPGGHVVLVQLVWRAPVDERRRDVLADHLGTRPLMLVEWKRIFRELGVRDVHNEDWTDEETAFRPQVPKPFPDFAELFTLTEKLGILRRAWKRWGWRGVSAALAREREVHRLLARERILGLDLLLGTKGEDAPREEPRPGPGAAAEPEPEPARPEARAAEGEVAGEEELGLDADQEDLDLDTDEEDLDLDADEEAGQLQGLPLFSDDSR